MDDSSLRVRQDEEILVLEAIYEDVKDLRTVDAWKVYRPPELRIKLKPQQSMGMEGPVYTEVDMLVKCPKRYPLEVPEIKLENPKGLSNNQVSYLENELREKSKLLVGEVMLLELSQHVQQFLHEHNKPPAKSFYEEMMSNKEREQQKLNEEQEKKLQLMKRKEEKERQQLVDEIQKRQEAMKEETKKFKEETRQGFGIDIPTPVSSMISKDVQPTISPIGTPGSPRRRTRLSVSPSPLIIRQNSEKTADQKPRRQRRTSTPMPDNVSGSPTDHQCKDHTGGVVSIVFNTKNERTIQRGACLGHSENGGAVFAGIDTSTGELVAITEWVLKWRHIGRKKLLESSISEDKDGAHYLKQIISIEQELLSLIKLHHQNLIHYLAIKYKQEPGKIIVYILMEYSGGLSLETNIKKCQPMSLDILKTYTEEILLALEYLHSKDVVHKNLRASSIFVDTNGLIRVSDYSIDKRMSDLHSAVENSQLDTSAKLSSRYGKKGDVYQLGLLLLSLVQGEHVTDDDTSIPKTLPIEFQDFLNKCLLKDDRMRWSVYQLLDHSFIKNPLQTVPHVLHPKTSKPKDKENLHKAESSTSESTSEEEDLVEPFITAFEASGQSRLTSEFEILKSLGKGGFGDVIKVRNKLDRRLYAIKRIPLNPKSKIFNKKITREVKLLSRLNHENVVRYYNSWIETSEDPAHSDSSSSANTISTTPKTSNGDKVKSLRVALKNSLDLSDDIEKFAPPPRQFDMSMDWSISCDTGDGAGGQNNSDSEDDDEDEADVFGTSFIRNMDTSEDVVFVQSFDNIDFPDDDKSANEKGDKTVEKSSEEATPKLQYLYIQMEYCERSTLRNCIDAGLYQDVNRVWRLFREIIEGLLHIHEQGMIHRDLKPVNIFLDSNDHVKIGDFGLATTNIVKPSSLSILEASLLNTSAVDVNHSCSVSMGEGDMTGKVGTALYVSPEMMTGELKITYSQKVDIYSLGIIFFEMCYRPLSTGMERVQILGNLRQKDIRLPDDFDQMEMENQAYILRWVLNHNPSLRPSSKDLLQSPYLPPPQMEEAELDEILRSAISDPQSKTYKHMVKTMVSQSMSAADDLLYDSEFYKTSFEMRRTLINQLVTDTVVKIFQKHGAVKMTTPLLMPRDSLFDSDHHSYFMDGSGRPVTLPFDLRVPFARYVARNNILHLKRYCIERVYRERAYRDRKVHGQHPRELTECAFDSIFTMHNSFIPDAELLVLIQDVINEFPVLQQRSYYIRINHMSVLNAILLHVLHTSIPEDKYEQVLLTLAGMKVDSHNRNHITKALSNLGLGEQTTSSLLNVLEMEGPVSKISSYLRCITKTRGPAAAKAKQGVQEIETIISNAETMGLKLPVIFTLGFIYNTKQYSGMIFQVMYDTKKKRRTIPDPLAAGGRYDGLVKKFYSPLLSTASHANVSHYAVGVSIALEKIISALAENKEYNASSPYDILVCTVGHKPMLKERMSVVSDLWSAGLRADILHETMQSPEHIQDFCRKEGIMFMVILKDGDTNAVKVKVIEKDRVTEKKIMLNHELELKGIEKDRFTEKKFMLSHELGLTEFLQQKINTIRMEQTENFQSQLGKATSMETKQPHSEIIQSASSSSNTLMINFTFIFPESNKIASNTKKKYEAQIFSKVSSTLYGLPIKNLELIATDLNSQVLKIIVAYLELDEDESVFESSISLVVEKQQRHRKYLVKIIDHIHHLKYEKKCSIIALYGLKDDSVKLLT